jgi:predicted O-methyltransferase YrrM
MIYKKLISAIKSSTWLHGSAKFIFMIYSVVANRCIKTITFSPPGHFYSPLPNLKTVKTNSHLIFTQVKALGGIDLRTNEQLELLHEFQNYQSTIPFSQEPTSGSRYYSNNRYFGEGDATILYCFLRHFKPKLLIEVGSGFSSALILDVNEKSFDHNMGLTFIEPYSARLLELLSDFDRDKCKLIEAPVQTVSADIFGALDKDDILFIDSSHIVKVGSDVAHIISNILPLLRPGVIVHFHDILWPFEYPEDWIMQGISWNEAYFLRAFLSFNSEFEILYFNSYIADCFPEEFNRHLSGSVKNPGGSIWIRKKY